VTRPAFASSGELARRNAMLPPTVAAPALRRKKHAPREQMQSAKAAMPTAKLVAKEPAEKAEARCADVPVAFIGAAVSPPTVSG